MADPFAFRQYQQLDRLTRAVKNLTESLAPLATANREVVETVEEIATSVEGAVNPILKFGQALGDPKSKLQPFLKFGYAFIPMFFRMKNAVELSSLAVGKFIETVKSGEGGGVLFSLGKNFLRNLKDARGILDGNALDEEGNPIGRIGALKNFLGGRLIKDIRGFFSRENDSGEQRERRGIMGILKNIGSVAMVLGKYLVLGSILIPLLIMFFKSKGFKTALKGVVDTLKLALSIFSFGFGLIKDGVMEIYSALTGDGTFLENVKTVFSGLLRIAGGILTTLAGALVATLGSLLAGLLTFLGFYFAKFLSGINERIKQNARVLQTLSALSILLVGAGAALFVAFSPLVGFAATIAVGVMGILTAITGLGLLKRIQGRARGGMARGVTLVGEEGPELVRLPGGSRVYSNAESKRMSVGSTNNITVNVQGRIGASDTELRQIASKIGQMINKEVNRTTSSRGTLG
jgi:hypothetical protein